MKENTASRSEKTSDLARQLMRALMYQVNEKKEKKDLWL